MALSQQRLLILAGAGGALALALLIVGIVAIRALGADPDHADTAPAAPGAEVASAGMHAPGTSELRKLGCDPAIVMDMTSLLGDAAALRPGEPRYIVTCDVPTGAAPSCDRAAGAYFAALGGAAGGNVALRIARPGASAPLCTGLYAPSGATLR